MNCEWEINEHGHHVCRLCGFTYRKTPPVLPLRKACAAKRPPEPLPPPSYGGLGDHVAMILDATGITEKRVEWFLKAAKLIVADGCGGCPQRREKLNRVGERLLKWVRGR